MKTDSRQAPDARERVETTRALVPTAGRSLGSREASIAGALGGDGGTLVAELVSVPEGTPLEVTDDQLATHRETVRESVASIREVDGHAEGVVSVGREPERTVADVATRYGVETVAVGLGDRPVDPTRVERLRGTIGGQLVTVRNADHLHNPTSLLVPVDGGPHSGAAVSVARQLADQFDAWLEIVHVMEPDPPPERRRRAERTLSRVTAPLAADGDWETWVLEADRVVETVIEHAAYYDGAVFGGPRRERLREFVLGSDAVHASVATPLFGVWSGDPDAF